MKILLKIKYIGTPFCGFQCQKNGTAVQNVLTEASEKVFGEKCNVTGCSRTDAGVHALGFCCTVAPENSRDGWCRIPTDKIHRAYQIFLPEEISVVGAAEVGDDFHPRYAAKRKQYIYRIWDAPFENPFEKGRSMRCIFPVTEEMEERMKTAAQYFLGKHDFASFMSSGSKVTDTVRTVTDSGIYRESGGALVFTVSADGFLYNMVRIMAGTLIDTAAGRIDPDHIPRIIEQKDRSAA
ncbi:MAG: tRNA pseudouridine synthase A, partial [Clostridia bacterium]|nr:tRNA pseudouridine synthase A [Clostridia bacterium]